MANKIKIGILGSNGTIGNVLLNYITSQNIIGITRDVCDLRDADKLKALLVNEKFDAIVNCATVGGKENINIFNNRQLNDNIIVFQNLKNLKDEYGVLINVGSGAEFDHTKNIANAKETLLDYRIPVDSYGLSKNMISKECRNIKNAVTLRIFGCFCPSEPPFRLLRNFVDSRNQQKEFKLFNDRKFSWISAIDFADVVEQVSINWKKFPKDMNCAYPDQLLLSEFIKKWCTIHNVDSSFEIENSTDLEYTCNTDFMKKWITVKYGFDKSLEKYI